MIGFGLFQRQIFDKSWWGCGFKRGRHNKIILSKKGTPHQLLEDAVNVHLRIWREVFHEPPVSCC